MGKYFKFISLLMSAVIAVAVCAEAGSGTVKVFILAGQSNMVGFGSFDKGRKEVGSDEMVDGGLGSLRHFVNENKKVYGPGGQVPLVDAQGKWITRDDVFLLWGGYKGPLASSDRFGPEYGFGQIVGNGLDEPVLIIKTAWGGKDLAVDFRPPSSGKTELGNGREAGAFYKQMLDIVKACLADVGKDFPELRGCKPVITGFGWHQGWNDGCSQDMINEYEQNMVNFIKDIRKEFGVEDLPFVIANSGMGNPTSGRRDELCKIQLAVGDRGKHREFAGTVASVETRGFWRPGDQSPRDAGFHWNANGESYFLVGESMGKAMLELLGSSAPKKAAAKPAAVAPVKPAARTARSLSPENNVTLDNALKSTLGKLSSGGLLKEVPLAISQTRARVWLKSITGDSLSFQIVGGTQTADFQWNDLSNEDHATLSQLVAVLKPESADAKAMAGVYLESLGRVEEADKYYEKAGKESREKLEGLFK